MVQVAPLPPQDQLEQIKLMIINHDSTFASLDEIMEAITKYVKDKQTEARIEELEYIKSQNVAIPCEPDCTELRHARHEGSWEQHLEFDDIIDNRLEELRTRSKDADLG